MKPAFGCHVHHADTIHCPQCGQVGKIIWENAARVEGSERDLVRIEGDFSERLRNKPPYPIELVCNGCGSAQRSRLQPE